METLQRTANRGSVSTGPYEIDNSLKFEADNSENLKWTDISTYATSARKKTFSFSAWVKITETGVQRTIWATSANGYLLLQADGQLKWQQSYGGSVKTLNTNRLFRDTSAWYNIIIAVDSTQSTEANRVRLYVNGVEETSLTSTTYPSQDAEAENVYQDHHYLGAYTGNQIYWCGYMSDVYFISDAQITPSDVGEYDSDSGIWIPKKYTGAISSPSYFLEFKDSSDLGTATSGLDADTLTNIAAADQSTDTPTNNFCTWVSDGTLFNTGTDNETFSEGGTRILTRAGTGWTAVYPTQSFAGGKWYMEVKVNENSATNMYGAMPVTRINSLKYQEYHHGQDVDGSIGIYANNGQIYWGTAGSGGSGGALSAGDIVGLAIDMENYKMYFAVNNTYVESGDPAGNSNGRAIEQEPYVFSVAHYTTTTVEDTNFGGYTAMSISSAASDENGYGTFEYAPPSGFLAVCTKNLAENGG
jgi:hypothetical protein